MDAGRTGRVVVVVALVVASIVAVWLTAEVASGSAQLLAWDDRVTAAVRGWADPLGWPVRVSALLGAVTAPLLSTVWAAGFAALLWRRAWRWEACWVLASAVTGVLVSETVKFAVGRTRPPAAALHRSDLTKSFPSGHAMAGIYLYVVMGVVLVSLGSRRGRPGLRRLGWALVVLGPLVGISRVVLGVHWPSDVLGGWAYGCAVALTLAAVLWTGLVGSETAASPTSTRAATPEASGSSS